MSRRLRSGLIPVALAVAAAAGVAMLVWGDRIPGTKASSSAPNLSEAEMRLAAARNEMCSPTNAIGVGLQGEYFTGELGRGKPALVRVDPTLDFDASLDWPAGRTDRPRAVRWVGWIKPPLTGRYRFHVSAPGARVTVSKQVLVGTGAPDDAGIDLAAGRFYPIAVEVSSLQGTPIRLEWTPPHGARYLVPRALLHMPTESVAQPSHSK